MKNEKIIKVFNGYLFVFITILLIAIVVYGVINEKFWLVTLMLAVVFLIRGFFLVNPNSSKVLLLFGKYVGTVKQNGFFWANPFYTRKRISLRASNFDSERVKVNDKLGNPIMISTILVWRVKNTSLHSF